MNDLLQMLLMLQTWANAYDRLPSTSMGGFHTALREACEQANLLELTNFLETRETHAHKAKKETPKNLFDPDLLPTAKN
jgi:hypothetical protein|tara:strand:- start:303 stop:539 length:237 start_codon:yes stop_codon:yes gene_type:complete